MAPTPPAAAPVAVARRPPPALVSFDVDGTLIRGKAGDRSANALHKQSFAAAWRACFGIDTHIDVCRHDGGTDPLILKKVLVECHGVDARLADRRMPEMERAMLDHYFSAAAAAAAAGAGAGAAGAAASPPAAAPAARPGDGLELLPGARETLGALAALGPGVAVTCLVTGNLEPIGWAKMRALGLEELFTGPDRFGGFGSDHCSGDLGAMWKDRAEFVRIARRRAEERAPSIGDHWHVGDTPADVRAALHAGAGAVAVATGAFSADELRRAGDEALAELAERGGVAGGPPPTAAAGRVVVLERGLADVEAVLAAIGLGGHGR
jgi:phosphoglycolate phosphatase-like HAD superfamily hydrolase